MPASNPVKVAAALAPVVTSEEGTPNTLLAAALTVLWSVSIIKYKPVQENVEPETGQCW